MGQESIPLYAISDLHFFTGTERQTYLQGGLVYEPYSKRLVAYWEREIEAEAWILIPGDISDSNAQGGMFADYRLLDRLPGRKLLSPGNHDHRPWDDQGKIERFCEPFPSLHPVTWGAVRLAIDDQAPSLVVACACGAHIPHDEYYGSELSILGPRDPRRRYQRELARLDEALAKAGRLRRPGDALAVQIHYTPFLRFREPSEFSRLIENAGADLCVFGHYHAEEEQQESFEGQRNGVEYRLVAAPRLNDRLLRLGELTRDGVTWRLPDR